MALRECKSGEIRMLYQYDVTLPLIYARDALNSLEKDHHMQMGLDQDIQFEVPVSGLWENSGLDVQQSPWQITISCGQDPDIDDLPDHKFLFHISHLTAHSKTEARRLMEPVLFQSCRALSMMLHKSNANRHLFQPRVEPEYEASKWKETPYPQKDDAAHAVRIVVDASCELTIYGKLASADFKRYYQTKNAACEYVFNEFYLALGQENFRSKFFHLFSVIEFIEREYAFLAGAEPLFEKEERQQVKKALKNILDNRQKQNRLETMVLQCIGKATDIGRDQKLVNILQGMNIREFHICDRAVRIDNDLIGKLRKKRNTAFHGAEETEEKNGISDQEAVTCLMYICPEIIEFIAEHPPAG